MILPLKCVDCADILDSIFNSGTNKKVLENKDKIT